MCFRLVRLDMDRYIYMARASFLLRVLLWRGLRSYWYMWFDMTWCIYGSGLVFAVVYCGADFVLIADSAVARTSFLLLHIWLEIWLDTYMTRASFLLWFTVARISFLLRVLLWCGLCSYCCIYGSIHGCGLLWRGLRSYCGFCCGADFVLIAAYMTRYMAWYIYGSGFVFAVVTVARTSFLLRVLLWRGLCSCYCIYGLIYGLIHIWTGPRFCCGLLWRGLCSCCGVCCGADFVLAATYMARYIYIYMARASFLLVVVYCGADFVLVAGFAVARTSFLLLHIWLDIWLDTYVARASFLLWFTVARTSYLLRALVWRPLRTRDSLLCTSTTNTNFCIYL